MDCCAALPKELNEGDDPNAAGWPKADADPNAGAAPNPDLGADEEVVLLLSSLNPLKLANGGAV